MSATSSEQLSPTSSDKNSNNIFITNDKPKSKYFKELSSENKSNDKYFRELSSNKKSKNRVFSELNTTTNYKNDKLDKEFFTTTIFVDSPKSKGIVDDMVRGASKLVSFITNKFKN